MRHRFSFISLIIFAALAGVSAADTTPLPFVSPMFGDNMVLQRGKQIQFWGWAKRGQLIRVDAIGCRHDEWT